MKPGQAEPWAAWSDLTAGPAMVREVPPEIPSSLNFPVILSSDSLILIPLGRNFQKSERCMEGKYYIEQNHSWFELNAFVYF